MESAAKPSPAIVQALLRLLRSHDMSGAWDNVPDEKLLKPFIVTKAEKREIPLIGDPDPDIIWRVELYYSAVAWEIERVTGRAVSPILRIHHEGWGRVVLIAGKLVVLSVHVRELHRFGFPTLDDLVTRAQALVEEGLKTIEAYPAVADA